MGLMVINYPCGLLSKALDSNYLTVYMDAKWLNYPCFFFFKGKGYNEFFFFLIKGSLLI